MKVRVTNKDMICLAVWHLLWQYYFCRQRNFRLSFIVTMLLLSLTKLSFYDNYYFIIINVLSKIKNKYVQKNVLSKIILLFR